MNPPLNADKRTSKDRLSVRKGVGVIEVTGFRRV